ncbi:hypothetical protein BCR37DRAFT_299890 [Protomyces lactucae-debilis]|uniref:Uncharacterized protein n=1 Tax=Protomyces lactucae-debilis TaxID=2754530 RepID=A0A1Y2FIY6_PROLT|nr:uncharacterized protein BCR37DRAFT_299890 [Protomyces lactucae-debilis]ORY83216.1 hypothetical protein BCR37DRAFT_299890 [Protomyces lactucae-debilis]
MRRSNSRSSQLGRSNSTRSVSSQAQSNASASAAAAAAAALAASQRRASESSTNGTPGLTRSYSNASIRSNATGGTGAGSRPGQYNAVRLTGSKRLMQQQQQAASSSPVTSSPATFGRPGSVAGARSKPPQVQQRRQGGMSSSASIRSFQSDLERINEDYNKSYTYTGQTSAGAMRTAGATSNAHLAPPLATTRGRRAESIASSIVSDSSDLPNNSADALQQKKRSSRVSFSDVDEQEDRRLSRDPSPAGGVKRSAMKPSPATTLGPGRGGAPAVQLVRRLSSSSLGSQAGLMAPPLNKPAPIGLGASTVAVASLTTAKEEDDLSTIHSHGSVYSDADEDFKASPAKQTPASKGLPRNGVAAHTAATPTLKLTQQNLAAVTAATRTTGPGSAAGSAAGTHTPIKSAMRKTPSQNGSVRFNDEANSHLDVDSGSDDSFAQRRRAKRINGGGMGMRSSLRGDGNGSVRSMARSERGSSQHGKPAAADGPRRMTSLRTTDRAERRQSMQEPSRQAVVEQQPNGLSRRMSMTSLRSQQQGPSRGQLMRRGSVAGSVAGSIHSEAVSQHIAVMEVAQRNVQRLLHKDANADVASLAGDNIHEDAREPKKRSSFERKRSTNKLQRRDSISSMQERTFRTSLRPESLLDGQSGHRRSASDDRAFAKPARPMIATSRSSMSIVPTGTTHIDAMSEPATPKTSRFRRMSFGFGSAKKARAAAAADADGDVPPVPSLPPMRRYSSDSDTPRTPRTKKETSALQAGTLRSPERVLNAETSAAAGARKTSLNGRAR